MLWRDRFHHERSIPVALVAMGLLHAWSDGADWQLILGLLAQPAVLGVVAAFVILDARKDERGFVAALRDLRRHIGRAAGAGFVSTLGIALGLVFLIIPGLILLARWALVVPVVVLEPQVSFRDAFPRSNELVAGRTGTVLVAMFTPLALTLVLRPFSTGSAIGHWVRLTVVAVVVALIYAGFVLSIYGQRVAAERRGGESAHGSG